MLLDPIELAEEVDEAARLGLPTSAIAQLAWAFAAHNGVVTHDGTAYLVLSNPLDIHTKLKLVAASLPTRNISQKIRTDEQVCRTFMHHLKGLEATPPSKDELWIPLVITGTTATRAMGGVLPVPRRTEHDGFSVDWYSLRGVPVGSLFFTVKKRFGDLAVYQRLDEQRFGRIQVQAATNLVDMHAMITSVNPGRYPLEGFEPVAGKPAFLY